jgi:MbtH protein
VEVKVGLELEVEVEEKQGFLSRVGALLNGRNLNQEKNSMSENHADWQNGPLKVVKNHEEQYSIWPIDRENPAGWLDAGKTGTKSECLQYIKEVWSDMRPLSIRRQSQSQSPVR